MWRPHVQVRPIVGNGGRRRPHRPSCRDTPGPLEQALRSPTPCQWDTSAGEERRLIDLYGRITSGNSYKVRLLLALLCIPYRAIDIRLGTTLCASGGGLIGFSG